MFDKEMLSYEDQSYCRDFGEDDSSWSHRLADSRHNDIMLRLRADSDVRGMMEEGRRKKEEGRRKS